MTLPPCTLPLGAPAAFVGGRVSVKEAFGGATLLLTGVTGYVGSVVLEHLLRVQPDVQRVFVIIRSKRGLAGMLGLSCRWPLSQRPVSAPIPSLLSSRSLSFHLPSVCDSSYFGGRACGIMPALRLQTRD